MRTYPFTASTTNMDVHESRCDQPFTHVAITHAYKRDRMAAIDRHYAVLPDLRSAENLGRWVNKF